MQPYHIAVDSKHNVWGNLWTSDRIVKLDPSDRTSGPSSICRYAARKSATSRCSSAATSSMSSMPVYRTNQMGVMTVRSEAEIAALKRTKN